MIGLEIRNLWKKMGPNQALSGVGFRVSPGHLCGLIGPEGAGKTTLLRVLAGLLKPNEGEVSYLLNGEIRSFESIRADIAYMPERQSLYPDLSVAEHMDFFKELYQVDESTYLTRRKELLHITRLTEFEDRPAGKLSGGMYKKLGLMCALLRSPKLLLLDEPTNGVDPISRREFWDLLYRLVHQGITVLVSTAYMDEAERCGQVQLLQDGKLLAEGEPREILLAESVDSFDAFYLKKGAEV